MTLPNVSVMPCQLLLQGLRAALTPVPHIVQLWIVSISSPAKYRPTQRLGIPRVPTRVVGLSSPQSLDRGRRVVPLPGSSESAPSHGGAHERPETPPAPHPLTDSISRQEVHLTSRQSYSRGAQRTSLPPAPHQTSLSQRALSPSYVGSHRHGHLCSIVTAMALFRPCSQKAGKP